jgi:hypothetical protein
VGDGLIETEMRKQAIFLAATFVLVSGFIAGAKGQKRPLPPRLLSARSVYFDNQTGYAAVGDDALRELQRWGRFQVVRRRDDAELLFVLSSETYTDDVSKPAYDGDFEPDLLHLPRKPANAYLTVVDTVTGQRLWTSSHPWGGLLTGFNSAGRRLINRLRKQVER